MKKIEQIYKKIIRKINFILGRIFRQIRNIKDRKKIKNKDFTILCNTCIGGVISHDLGLQFKSPTVNLYMTPTDFVKFLENLDYYLQQQIVSIPYEKDYPVGKLGDITIYFKHYASIEEARDSWEKRKRRINWDNLFVMMTDRWCCPYSTLERFDKLNVKNKVCFTAKNYPEFYWAKQITKHSEGCVYIITNIMNIWGKRLYEYASEFNYIDWLNNDN